MRVYGSAARHERDRIDAHVKSRSNRGADDNAEEAAEEEEEEDEDDADVPDAVVIRVKGNIVSGTDMVYPTGLPPTPQLLGRAWRTMLTTSFSTCHTLVS